MALDVEQQKVAINALPQIKHIQPGNIDAWLASVPAKDDPMWHIRRLTGIGGSEIGVLLAWQRQERHPFKSAVQLLKEKLLQVPLEEATAVMRRGTRLEPVIQQMFLEDTLGGAESKLDRWSKLERLAEKNTPDLLKQHPWIRGNPDDLVEINGKQYIVDYKAPGNVPTSVPETYEAQVSLYAIKYEAMLKHNNINVEVGTLVVSYDHGSGTCSVSEVERSPHLEQEILTAGDKFWNEHVLLGKKPELIFSEDKAELPDDETTFRLDELEKELLQLKLIADAAYAQLKDKQTEYFRLAGDCKIDPSTMTVSSSKKIIEEDMDTICAINQIDSATLKTAGNKLDDEKVCVYLLENNQDPQQFREQSYDKKLCEQACETLGIEAPVTNSQSLGLRAGKKCPKEQLAALKDTTAQILERAKADLRKNIFEDDDHHPSM